ncbi:CHAD domain-containing protein [Bacillus salacetis]|uniref:CHAD domain-containing protein n=1 Tax=Bacillus salacetis TaxID=2315464 RepID=UPI003BA064BC
MKIVSVTRILDDRGRFVFPEEARKTLDLKDDLFLSIDNAKQIIHVSKNGHGVKRTLDESGRLSLPSDYLQQLNWKSGSEIGLYIEGVKGILQEKAPSCVICGSNQTLLKVKKTLVCNDCIQTGNEAMVNKWADMLENLLKEYKGYCDDAVSFKDTEDVHKSRTKGRRLRTLIHFIGVGKDHPLYERLKKAHDALGKVREEDVFIESFEKEAETNSYGDVYREFTKEAGKKRDQHRKKLKKKLPDIIDEKFMSQFHSFLKNELKNYILPLDISSELQKQEKDFDKRVNNYHQVIAEEGKFTEEGIDALHEVRKKAKKLRYIYSYLDKLYSEDYKSNSKPYKKIQKKFGDIIDLRDWLDEMDSLEVGSKEEDVQSVRNELQQRQKKFLEQITL